MNAPVGSTVLVFVALGATLGGCGAAITETHDATRERERPTPASVDHAPSASDPIVTARAAAIHADAVLGVETHRGDGPVHLSVSQFGS